MSTLRGIRTGVDFESLQHHYPPIYQELKEDAARHGQSNLTEYLEHEFDDINSYLEYCCKNYFTQWQRVKVRDLVEIYKRSISLPKAPENMARYQYSLDNELYKGVRVLKEAQAWRGERRLNMATTVSNSNTD